MVDPGNNLNSALNVGNLSSLKTFKDFVGTVDQVDVYSFNLTQTSNLAVNLSDLDHSAEIYLVADLNQNGVRDDGEKLYSDYGSNGYDGEINLTLGTGSYFALVETGDKSVNTNYNLSLLATANLATTTSNPGNNLNGALNMGNLGSPKTFKDFVGTVDQIDVYRFNLTQISNLAVNLSGLDDSAEVLLVADLNQNGVRDDGEELHSDYGSNGYDGEINVTLGAGSYFAWINTPNKTVNTNYSLNLSATANLATTTSNPGNNLNGALNMGNLGSPKTFKNFVGTVDRTDVYRFNLTQTSNLALNLGSLDDSAEVYLVADLNQNGVRDDGEDLYSEYGYRGYDGEINATLSAGSYFVWVETPYTSSNTNYNLSLSATATTPSSYDDYMVGNYNDEVIDALAGNDYIEGRFGNDRLSGGSGNDSLFGEGDNDKLFGGLGDDFLDGGFGNDSLVGGAGNDTYVLDNISDIIVENLKEGTDTVITAVTYTLGANLENLTLSANTLEAINATGNNLNNVIKGNEFNNTLSGGTGTDTLKGGKGSDQYYVDLTGDLIVENANEGTDVVMSRATYVLSSNIEKLTLIGSSSINGTGNTLSNQITGNSGANLLHGGSSGKDSLIGGAGNDSLIGGSGNDILTGGTGSDQFLYDTNTAFISSAVGKDQITDFTHLSDKIVLDKTTFKALTSIAGSAFNVASEFAIVTSDAAVATSKALIVYSSGTGNLFYNENGATSGFGSGDQFAALSGIPALSASDFVIKA